MRAAGEVAEQLYARFDPRHYRIDVRQAPLLRVYDCAMTTAQGRWLMLLLQHHLIGDHTTLEVMQEEIQAHLLGEAEQLPAATAIPEFCGAGAAGGEPGGARGIFPEDAGRCRRADGALWAGGCAGGWDGDSGGAVGRGGGSGAAAAGEARAGWG